MRPIALLYLELFLRVPRPLELGVVGLAAVNVHDAAARKTVRRPPCVAHMELVVLYVRLHPDGCGACCRRSIAGEFQDDVAGPVGRGRDAGDAARSV